MNGTYQRMFTPLTIRGITLKNHIKITPIFVFDPDITPERHPSERDIQFFHMRATGGVTVVTLGDCIIDPSGEDSGKLVSSRVLAGHKDNLPFLTRIADEIHRYGAVANIKLNHAGILRASAGVQTWGPDYINFDETKTIAPLSDQSTSGEPVYHKGGVLFMIKGMIETVVDAFGRVAEQVRTCGSEIAMIHAGRGWLIHRFPSPSTNCRADYPGGSLKNRARLPLVIIDCVHQYCGEDFLIRVRFNDTEYVEGSYTLREGVEFTKLTNGKADLLYVSACNFCSPETECLMVPGMFREKGHSLYPAGEIREHMKHSHVVSMDICRDPRKIEDILTTGEVDTITVCHAVNADPQFVNKLKKNQEEEIRPCLRCNACIANYQTYIAKCTINPTLGRPEDGIFPFLLTMPKRMLTAGGGPIGLGAAIITKDRGYEVTLCEKTGMLDGLLRHARKVSFKRETQQYVDYMIAKAVHAGVGIRLDTKVTSELVKIIALDFCVATVGSKALIPPIPDVEETHSIMNTYDGKVQIGQKVVIADGGLAGTETALELTMQGKQVTLVEMGIGVARDADPTRKPTLMMEPKNHTEQVTILYRIIYTGIHDHGTVCKDVDGKELTLDADTVIPAAGTAPLRAEALALEPVSSEFRTMGNCRRPYQILEAVREGYDAAMEA